VARFAPGRSFADVGCMWGVDGAIAFLAEECGAARVTGVDVMAPTEAFEREHARRGSAVRFVRGDLHAPETVAEVGVHDVVWCSGVLYHAPSPLLTLERLRQLCGEWLLLGTETVREWPWSPGRAAFHPARRRLARRRGAARVGLDTPFDPAAGYANWWWGLSPSAVRAMVQASGFAVQEEHRSGRHLLVVARADSM